MESGSGPNGQHRKIITAPSLKRGKDEITPLSEKVKLERVLGLTVSNNAGLDCDPNNELVAYPAGCTVVLTECGGRGRQSHVVNTCRKTITCLRFSPDGRYLATGECGHAPSLRLWDLQEGSVVAEMTGHKYSINCLAFSPTQKYIVSVGSQHDMIVNVWDWRSGLKVASNKVSTKVKAISFAENGTYFVTVGNRHVKFWYLDYHRGSKYKEPVPLMGRSAILGEQRNNDFVDVACGRGDTADSTYTITRSGLLCEFNNRRLLDKWVELRTTSANCMALGERRIFIGCADGIVRCFDPQSLQFITTLPRTHYLGVDVAQGLDISHMASHPKNPKFPDTIAVSYDERGAKLTCVYNDHSLYVWDVKDIKRVGKSQSYLYHSACIWGVEMFPEGGPVPLGSFITCSSDDTIRVWNVDGNVKTLPNSSYQRNIYSKELLKVLYVDPELVCLKDIELAGGDKSDNPAAYDGKNGVRSLRISPDGKHLASGDRAGNIRVHDTRTLEEICLIEAHDAEVLCLEYSLPECGVKLLASASRDRLVHVFDVSKGYNFLQTLDDHSSSITAVRFLSNHQNLQMVSCGADKSIIFRQLQTGSDGQVQFTRMYNAAGKTTLYDMEIDVSHKHVITACQDRNIRVYNVSSGKHSKTFKGSIGEDGSLIKVTLDASGIFVATSCTDKTLCIYDYYSGECMATMSGHSELVTGLRFSPDCTKLISASGDGCVLVWTVPHDMVVTMQARLAQQQARAKKPTTKIMNGLHIDNEDFGSGNLDAYDPNSNQADYRYSFGQLPVWAKKELDGSETGSGIGRTPVVPRGRWAQRVGQSGITIKSVLDDQIIILPKDRRLDSDGSKEDSSVDSGAEMGKSILKRESLILTKVTQESNIEFMACPDSLHEILEQENKSMISSKITMTRGNDMTEVNQRPQTDDSSLGSFKYEDMESTEHDGDVEDCSEGESSDSRRPLYIPTHDEPNREFPITNMDAVELRKSMRKSKRPDLLMVTSEISSASRSVSGSQSDEDDHTPTSDHAHHSVSSDTLDVIGHREKYLKNTFESLSGAEESLTTVRKGKRSLSSQHHVSLNTGIRNSNVIQAAKVAKNDTAALSKREELQRRIQETRRQLQSVGYRSNLKMSQSIQDLSLQGVYNSSGGGERQKPTPRHRAVQQGNEIDSSTFTRRPRPTNTTNNKCQRPASLNLSQLSVNPYKSGSKSMETSLTGSPIYDKLSPTNFTDTEMSMKFAAHEANRCKRYSCTFYVNINENTIDNGRESKSCDDLNEICKNHIFLSSNDKITNETDSEYSSDSLEECSRFRRCVSEYLLERSSSAFGFKDSSREKTKFHSEENILADDPNENWDRHSSASFFLRKNNCRSTESILTDESEYQYLFESKEVFRSTESILTDGGDLKELPDDALDEIPMKQTVSRTRSLQETGMKELAGINISASRPETPYASYEMDNKKNESFFIPIGDSPIKRPNPPNSLLKKYQSRDEKKMNSNNQNHPVVAHKPPKPKINVSSSRIKNAQKRINKLLSEKKSETRSSEAVFRKDLWEAPVKDPGLNSIPDLPQYTGGRVKLLSQNFERISAREEVSCDSGSSTPGTSSSCANSPKRKWKPSIGNQLARRIANGQLLPDKCSAVQEEPGGIRRACSLSDLANPSPRAKNSFSVPSKPSTTKSHSSSRHSVPKSNMMRSSSVGVLNQSDSESDISQTTGGGQRSLVSLRVMRPTISSQNKMSANASSKALAARRRALSGAYSAIALNQGGNTEDSSSEENPSPPVNSKPTPPPRPKSVSNLDRSGGKRPVLGRSGSERDLNRGGGGVGTKVHRSASGMVRTSNLDPSPYELPVKDITSAPLSEHLISSMAEQLQKAAESVVQLHSRLQSVNPEERDALLGGLSGAIGEAQKALGLVLPKQP